MSDISVIERSLVERMELAEQGRLCWNRLVDLYQFDEDCRILCFPGNEKVYFDAVRDCLDEFISKYGVKRLYLLSEHAVSMSTGLDCHIESVTVEKKNMEALVCLYEMSLFSFSILFISEDVPNNDGKWRRLIEDCDVSLYDAIKRWLINYEVIGNKRSGMTGGKK